MRNNPNTTQNPNPESAVGEWLLDSDPAIRWQVMKDLASASPEDVADERGRVAIEGLGAQLLALQAPDGRWGNAARKHYRLK